MKYFSLYSCLIIIPIHFLNHHIETISINKKKARMLIHLTSVWRIIQWCGIHKCSMIQHIQIITISSLIINILKTHSFHLTVVFRLSLFVYHLLFVSCCLSMFFFFFKCKEGYFDVLPVDLEKFFTFHC